MMTTFSTNDLFNELLNVFPVFSNEEINKAEKTLFGGFSKGFMNTDIKESEGGYEMLLDLPGFAKENLQISLEDGYMTVEAKKDEEKSEEKDGAHYVMRERRSGSMSRSFYVGDAVTEEDIKAEFDAGVLKLFIPKKTENLPEKKFITIG